MPEAFIKTGSNKCRVILDCTDVFTERPKSLNCQAATCSDYKYHNTIKSLVGYSPTCFITFLNSCYGCRASDNFIPKDSGFYNLLERDHVVMADCGFWIQEDLLLHYCNLLVPPGAWTKSQMTKKMYRRQKKLQIYEFTLREQLIE